ncbi:MAG: STAS domain-containing protein [Candidatus Peregrinibacteria bacterium]
MSKLSIRVIDSPQASVKVVALSGEMEESGIETLRPQLDPLLNEANVKKLVFDLQDLEFINSKGIGYLVAVHTHLAKGGRQLIMAGARESIMDVVNLVGLTTIIPYFETVEEALT